MDVDIIQVLQQAQDEGIVEIPECGCIVEPDGECPCGHESPLLTHGMI